jgi:tetratricopeptide (TPR) repeat protein
MPSPRTYKAFVSSTFIDLKEHRAHVIRALRKAGIHVDPMEDWTADANEPKRFSQERVHGCDLCILLVAFRRGYVPDGETLSITQFEYQCARDHGIDVLPFLLDEDAPWPRRFDELATDPAIREWRAQLGKLQGVGKFGLDVASLDVGPAVSRWLQGRAATPTAPTVPPEPPPVREGVPPRPGYALVGRDHLLEQLKGRLLSAGGGLALSAVHGLPGVGKTALAIELAHDPVVLKHFRHGVLWAGLGRQPDVLSLLGAWARAVGVPPDEIAKLNQKDDRARAVKAAIGSCRLLLVMDDAWQTGDASLFIKAGGPDCAYLVTTRFREIASDFDDTKKVPELSAADGLTLLDKLAPAAVKAEPDTARDLVEAVGRLPLALALMGKYLRKESADQPRRRLRAALDRLRDAEGRLKLEQRLGPLDRPPGLPEDTPLSLQAVIGVSDENLPDGPRSTLRALAVFPPKPNSFSEAAALAAAEAPAQMLDVLSDHGLLEGHQAQDEAGAPEGPSEFRYALHQTIADYARARLTDPAAYERAAAFFADFLQGHQADYDALDLEHANLKAAWSWCHEAGQAREADRPRLGRLLIRLANGLVHYLWARGYWDERVAVCRNAFEAARSLDDWKEACWQAYAIGWVFWQQGNLEQAQTWAEECLRAAEKARHSEGLSLANHLGGLVALSRKEHDRADALFRQALETASPERTGLGGRGSIMSELGRVHLKQNRLAEARNWYEQCVRENERTGFVEGVGISKGYLARTLFLLGQIEEAESLYREALAIAVEVGRATTIARIHHGLAELLLHKGKPDDAEGHAREARPIYQRLGMREDLAALEALEAQIKARRGQSGSSV